MDGKHTILVTVGAVLMVLVAAQRLAGLSAYEDGASWSPASQSVSAMASPRGIGSGIAAKLAARRDRKV